MCVCVCVCVCVWCVRVCVRVCASLQRMCVHARDDGSATCRCVSHAQAFYLPLVSITLTERLSRPYSSWLFGTNTTKNSFVINKDAINGEMENCERGACVHVSASFVGLIW